MQQLNKLLYIFSFLVASLLFLNACSDSSKEQEPGEPATQILVLGTNHYIPDSAKEEAAFILAKLIDYKPDLVATEYSPYDDSLSLSSYYAKYYQKFQGMRREAGLSTDDILDSIHHYQALPAADTALERLAKLARFYYMLGDLSNSRYYAYQLQRKEAQMSPDRLAELKAIMGDDIYDTASRQLKNDEYGNIVFPLALSQKLKETIAVDHQARADSFVYWQKHHYKLLIEKYTKPGYDSIMEAYRTQQQAEAPLTMLSMNTHQYIEEHPDFHWPIPGLEYDSLTMLKTLEPWDYRNELAIERLDAAIRRSGSKRAIITFGAMHAPPFIEILKKYPQYEVLLVEDL